MPDTPGENPCQCVPTLRGRPALADFQRGLHHQARCPMYMHAGSRLENSHCMAECTDDQRLRCNQERHHDGDHYDPTWEKFWHLEIGSVPKTPAPLYDVPHRSAEQAMWGSHYGEPGEPGWEGTDEEYAAAMAAGQPPAPDKCTNCLAITTGWSVPATGPDELCDDCREPEDPHDVATPEADGGVTAWLTFLKALAARHRDRF